MGGYRPASSVFFRMLIIPLFLWLHLRVSTPSPSNIKQDLNPVSDSIYVPMQVCGVQKAEPCLTMMLSESSRYAPTWCRLPCCASEGLTSSEILAKRPWARRPAAWMNVRSLIKIHPPRPLPAALPRYYVSTTRARRPQISRCMLRVLKVALPSTVSSIERHQAATNPYMLLKCRVVSF